MSDSVADLQRQIATAIDLQSVVRTMRALAASSITQYEQSVAALAHYQDAVDQGLGACIRQGGLAPAPHPQQGNAPVGGAIVFGSDQGLVGQFNDSIAEYAAGILARGPGQPRIWAVGERVRTRLEDSGLVLAGMYEAPHSVDGIGNLVDRLQLQTEVYCAYTASASLIVFHNRPLPGSLYEPIQHRLLPLDDAWSARLAHLPWPGTVRPEVLGHGTVALRALVREHLFISLFRACAESLASENASRLAAMERAERNIEQQLESLHGTFHRLRQNAIDAELFDVLAASG